MTTTEQCLVCKWARPFTGGCEAFPDEIPAEFADGTVPHDKPTEDQVGEFVFEEGEPAEIAEILPSLPDGK